MKSQRTCDRLSATSWRSRWRRYLIAALAWAMASSSMQAYAWGADGHRLVATVADRQLSPAAKAAVAQLLALEPGATLESISTWADEVRSPATAAWHYVNFPRGGPCQYGAAPICIEGLCVVAAIERQAAVLASSAPDDVRLRALKYVVHLVADVHQPLHAGYADDRGANSHQLQAFGRGTNLHALWDSGLIANWPGGVSALLAAVEADRTMTDMAVAPATWAEESCRAVGTEGFYPASHKLDAEYAQRWSQTLVRQLAAAGSRLAAVLNGSLPRP